MIEIKKKEANTKKLIRNSLLYLSMGALLTISGYMVQNYFDSVISGIRGFFNKIASIVSNCMLPLHSLNIFAVILFFMSTVFIVKGIFSLKDVFSKRKISKRDPLFSKLPNNYFMFKDIPIGHFTIPNVLICPKGIFTVHTNLDIDLKKVNTFATIKQSILHSKALNDFMQKSAIGNYYVRTIVLMDTVDDKVKIHFSDIPVLQPDNFYAYVDKLESKYSDEECSKLIKLLKISLCSLQANKNLSSSSTMSRKADYEAR